SGANHTVNMSQNTTYAFTASDFGFSDPLDSNSLTAVKIVGLNLAGTLALNGTAVTAGQVISIANINSGLLTFTPATNATGTPYTSFTFKVQDDGGTTNGGIDLDPTPRLMTINVT